MIWRELRLRLWLLLLSGVLLLLLLLVRRSELLYLVGDLVGGDLVERSVIGSFLLLIGLSCGLGILCTFPLFWINGFLFTCSGLTRVEQRSFLYYGCLSSVLLVVSVVGFSLFYSEVVGSLYAFRVNDLVLIESMGVVEDHYSFLMKALVMVVVIGQFPLVMEVILALRLLTTVGILRLRRHSLLIAVSSLAFMGSLQLLVLLVFINEFLYFKKRLKEL